MAAKRELIDETSGMSVAMQRASSRKAMVSDGHSPLTAAGRPKRLPSLVGETRAIAGRPIRSNP